MLDAGSLARSPGGAGGKITQRRPPRQSRRTGHGGHPINRRTAAAGGDVGGVEGGILAAVQARGVLRCGVSGTATAFSEQQPDGSATGFDADYCRYVAAAVLGDSGAVEFTFLTAAERFTAIQTGAVDVLIRNTTWTQSRDSDVGMDFAPTTYYDGQQVMARGVDGFSSTSAITDLEGAVICTNAGTTTEKNITEMEDKLSADDKSKLDAAVGRVKEALKGENMDEIKSSSEALSQVWSEMASKMYQANEAPADGAEAQATAEQPEDAKDETVEEADFEVVDDDKSSKK